MTATIQDRRKVMASFAPSHVQRETELHALRQEVHRMLRQQQHQRSLATSQLQRQLALEARQRHYAVLQMLKEMSRNRAEKAQQNKREVLEFCENLRQYVALLMMHAQATRMEQAAMQSNDLMRGRLLGINATSSSLQTIRLDRMRQAQMRPHAHTEVHIAQKGSPAKTSHGAMALRQGENRKKRPTDSRHLEESV